MFPWLPTIFPIFSGVCILFLAACSLPEGPAKRAPPFRIHFIDVGQGDACLMRTPGGKFHLYDVGNRASDLLEFLRAQGVDTLAAIYVSHPDLDHFGALPALLSEFPVKHAYLPPLASPENAWQEAVHSLDERGIKSDTLFAGDTLIWEGDVRVRALWPEKHALQAPSSGASTTSGNSFSRNALSLILRIESGGSALLLTGDAEDASERAVLATGEDPRASLLKVGHHGSRTSSSLPFLAAVRPRWAIISCDSSVYGHPHAETIAGLTRILGDGVRILRTDREGTISFEIDTRGVRRLGRVQNEK